MMIIIIIIMIHAELCLAVCDPLDCSPPGSSVHGIPQARIVEWVAISSSRGSSSPRDRTRVSFIGRQVLYLWCQLGGESSVCQAHSCCAQDPAPAAG